MMLGNDREFFEKFIKTDEPEDLDFLKVISLFPEYHKIETLFERDKETFLVDTKRIKTPVFETINKWDVTEKIDGTNIRIGLSKTGFLTFGGRTNNAQIPADLVQYLIKTFPVEKLKEVMLMKVPMDIVLYGEGYGSGIQNGGKYRSDKSFILFDVLVSGTGGLWWLNKNSVESIANKLGIESVPYLGRMSFDEIIEMVKTPFKSKIGNAIAEGIVARPVETLFDKTLKRIIMKLKTKDFIG